MNGVISINFTNDPNISDENSPFCVEIPIKLINTISGIIYFNGIFGFLSNLLIFICYSLFKTGKKLTTTECFIAFLSLADMTFSVSVLFIGISGHVLSEQALQSCYFYKFTAILHAFEQFLSWLLFLGITIERFISICKVRFHMSQHPLDILIWGLKNIFCDLKVVKFSVFSTWVHHHTLNREIIECHTVVILINATKQFWYAVQNPKCRSK